MKKHPSLPTLLVAALALLPLRAAACTSFLLSGTDGGHVYGRSMEFGQPFNSQGILIQRGTAMEGVGPDGKPGSGLKWTTKYAVVGLNVLGQTMVVDGINEKGLAGGLLNFVGYAQYQNVPAGQEANSIVSWQMLTYVLSNFATLDEVKEGLPKILVNGAPLASFGGPAQIHMTLHDNQGNSIVVEYLKEGLQIKDNPTGILTNNPPFDYHLAAVGDYANLSNNPAPKLTAGGVNLPASSSGDGFIGLPGDFLSSSRFVQAFTFVRFAPSNLTTAQQVNTAFHFLGQFDLPPGSVALPVGSAYGGADKSAGYEITEWVVAADMKNLIYYVRTFDNFDFRSLNINDLPLDGGKAIVMALDQKQSVTPLKP